MPPKPQTRNSGNSEMPQLTVDQVKELINVAVEPFTQKIDKLENDISTLKDAHEKQLSKLNSKISQLEKKIKENAPAAPPVSPLSTENTRLLQITEKINLMWRKIDDLDQYSRRQNLIIDGIPVRKNETPKQILRAVSAELDRLDLPINDCEIDRAHRTSAPYTDQNGIRKQAVICRFVSWGARDTLYQARQQSKYRFRADLTNERLSTLTYARNQIDKRS